RLSAIDKSVNGGETFHRHHFGQLSTIKNYGLDNLIMFSKDKGVALSLGWLLLTEDNWSSYEVVDIPEEYYLDESMFYIDSNNIAFLNIVLDNDTSEYFNQFVKYNTISKEWSLYSNIEKRDNKSEYPILLGLSIVNDTIIYACGFQKTGVADLAYDLVWKSTDKGKNWDRILKDSSAETFGLNYLSFRNEKHGIAVGSWSNIIETTDGGETWRRYPESKAMASITSEITWAGSSAIYTSDGKGIYRLETKSEVEELSSNEKFKVYQSGDNLEIAINDDTYASYEFRLYNSSGQLLQTNRLKSNFGFLFETVELVPLNSGVYYYSLSQDSNNQFYGKLIIVN
ncbi:T9SS type A sorting domain-containing protein, partial [bacterium]